MNVAPGRERLAGLAAFAAAAGSLVLTTPWAAVEVGWEAWGGLLMMALAGASSSRWRVRPSEAASLRASRRVGLLGLGFAAGAFVRSASPWPLMALLVIGLLAQPPARAPREALTSLALVLLAFAAGLLFVNVSTVEHATRLGAALAVGAFAASLWRAPARFPGGLPLALLALAAGAGLAGLSLR